MFKIHKKSERIGLMSEENKRKISEGNKGKKKMHKSTKIKMIDMMELFKDKKNVLNGLTSNEFISLFHKIPIEKVNNMNKFAKDDKWKEIQFIRKMLIKTRQMAIIHKSMPMGTELINKLGRRVLNKNTNIFFRCVDLENGWSYRNKMDRLIKGIEKISEGVVSIAEEEVKSKEKEVLEIVR